MTKSKKTRQYRSNQGRSPEAMEKTYQGCFWTIIIGFVLVIICMIYNFIII